MNSINENLKESIDNLKEIDLGFKRIKDNFNKAVNLYAKENLKIRLISAILDANQNDKTKLEYIRAVVDGKEIKEEKENNDVD